MVVLVVVVVASLLVTVLIVIFLVIVDHVRNATVNVSTDAREVFQDKHFPRGAGQYQGLLVQTHNKCATVIVIFQHFSVDLVNTYIFCRSRRNCDQEDDQRQGD